MQPYYEQDGIRIFHGDCFQVLPGLDAATVDLLLTDPPFFMPAQHYSSRAKARWRRSWGDTSILGRWWADVMQATAPCLACTAHALVFCNAESYPVFYPPMLNQFEHLAALVWDKDGLGMGLTWRHSHEFILAARFHDSPWYGGHALRDILTCRPVPPAARVHPVDKPVGLLAALITATTAASALLLDPFMGGGSTLIAAAATSRRAIGIEIEERYCEIAAKRLQQQPLPPEVPA